MNIRKTIFFLLALLAILLLSAKLFFKTSANTKEYNISTVKLGTVISIVFYSEKEIDFDSLREGCLNKIDDAERTFSIHKKDSEINRLNKEAFSKSFYPSPGLLKMISRSKDYWEKTNGAFDPTILPILKLWGLSSFNKEEKKELPCKSEIEAMLSLLGMEKVKINQDEKVRFENDTLLIDLGGIAKGFIIDEITDYLKNDPDIISGIVNIGGDCRCFQKNKREAFKIGMCDPLQKDSVIGYVKGKNISIFTSGGYERYREYKNKKYIHIIDPISGYPLKNGVLSVTVMGDDSVKCDALATALMVLGPEKGKELIEKEKVKVFFIVHKDGKVDRIAVNGFELINEYN